MNGGGCGKIIFGIRRKRVNYWIVNVREFRCKEAIILNISQDGTKKRLLYLVFNRNLKEIEKTDTKKVNKFKVIQNSR